MLDRQTLAKEPWDSGNCPTKGERWGGEDYPNEQWDIKLTERWDGGRCANERWDNMDCPNERWDWDGRV